MSSAFSVGDFVALTALAFEVAEKLPGTTEQYLLISHHLRKLIDVLRLAVAYLPTANISDDLRQAFVAIIPDCERVLKDIAYILGKYAESGSNKRRELTRLAFKSNDLRKLRGQIIDCTERLHTIISLVNAANFDERVILKRLDHRERQEIFHWLSPIDYAAQQSDLIRVREAGTGQWLLDSTEYQGWVATTKQSLFCPGIPGAGKTMLMSIVVNDLLDKFFTEGPTAICYIYCNSIRSEEQRLDDLLVSLLRQLAQGQDPLSQGIVDLFERYKERRTRPSIEEICKTLYSVAATYTRVFVLVDALDECEVSTGCRSRFISELLNLHDRLGVNLFATSRFIPEITERFTESTTKEIRATTEDIERYLERSLTSLPRSVSTDPDLKIAIKEEIGKAADGMFLFARLCLDSLKDRWSRKAVHMALKGFKTDLQPYDVVFAHEMENIRNEPPDKSRLALRALSWIAYAERPLKTVELQHALGVELDESSFDKDNVPDVQHVVSCCGGLLIIDKATCIVRPAHYKIHQCLREQSTWFETGQTDMANICITYLSLDIFESGRCTSDSDFEDRLSSYPFYDYASHYWGRHVSLATSYKYSATFLETQCKVDASVQCLLARKEPGKESGYSMKTPTLLTGLHLAAFFGLDRVTAPFFQMYDYNGKDSDSRTPISYAAENGHENVVQLFIKEKAEIDSEDQHGRTPLSYAAGSGQDAVMLLLLQNGAEADSKDRNDRTPLSFAAESRSKVAAQLLLAENAEVDSKDRNHRTPLSFAAENGNKPVLRLLLEKGAKADSQDLAGKSPISYATAHRHGAVVHLLLEDEALIPCREEVIKTIIIPLLNTGNQERVLDFLDEIPEALSFPDYWLQAVQDRKLDVATLLLERNQSNTLAPVDWENVLRLAIQAGNARLTELLLDRDSMLRDSGQDRDESLLFLAVKYRQTAVVELLLEKFKMEVNSKNGAGETIMQVAASHNDTTTIGLLLSQDNVEIGFEDKNGRSLLSILSGLGESRMVETLLQRSNVNLNSRDCFGRTPLSWAAEAGRHEIVSVLVRNQSLNVDEIDENGWTPLFWAASQAHEQVVSELIRAKADSGHQDQEGRTVLHHAAQRGLERICQVLVGHVNYGIIDRNGNTALLVALDNGNNQVVQHLLSMDDATLALLVAKGDKERLKELLDAGGEINSVNTSNQTLVHLSVIHEVPSILRLLISRKADINLRDISSKTPLQHAVKHAIEHRGNTNCTELIELLLLEGSDMGGIDMSEWRSAFKQEDSSNILVVSEQLQRARGYSVAFRSLTSFEEWPDEATTPAVRRLFVTTAIPAFLSLKYPTRPGLLYHFESNIHILDAQFSTEAAGIKSILSKSSRDKLHNSLKGILEDRDIRIAWTLPPKPTSGNTVDQFTTFCLGFIPTNGLELFLRMLKEVEKEWKDVCHRASIHLIALRRAVINSRGRSFGLIDEVLRNAQLLAHIRELLELHAESAASFKSYYNAYHSDSVLKYEEVVSHFATKIRGKLDQLDEMSEHIIQLEFNLVSINEARQSTTISTSMKRLSWITFIFLPATFSSSLFGMNVDVLANNPDWRWYLLTGTLLLFLTFLSWIIIKYGDVESWIESSVGSRIERFTQRSNGETGQRRRHLDVTEA